VNRLNVVGNVRTTAELTETVLLFTSLTLPSPRPHQDQPRLRHARGAAGQALHDAAYSHSIHMPMYVEAGSAQKA
jgi:hypothetical protein